MCNSHCGTMAAVANISWCSDTFIVASQLNTKLREGNCKESMSYLRNLSQQTAQGLHCICIADAERSVRGLLTPWLCITAISMMHKSTLKFYKWNSRAHLRVSKMPLSAVVFHGQSFLSDELDVHSIWTDQELIGWRIAMEVPGPQGAENWYFLVPPFTCIGNILLVTQASPTYYPPGMRKDTWVSVYKSGP